MISFDEFLNFEKGIPFDPGIGELVFHFSSNFDTMNSEIFACKTLHQKKFRYRLLLPQIQKLLENSIAFYKGCLMWAYYINKKFSVEQKEITGNSSLGKNSNEYDFLFEIDALIASVKKIQNDTKYFLGQNIQIDENWMNIAEVYRNFLILNDNFTQTKTCADIKLPKNIEFVVGNDLNKIIKKLYSAISNKDLIELFAQGD